MNLGVFKSPSFSGAVARERIYNYENGRKTVRVSTESEFLDSYDSQIRAIEAKKQQAIEFDNFMHSEEMAEVLAELPVDDVIEIVGNLSLDDATTPSEIDFNNPFLLYRDTNTQFDTVAEKEMTALFPDFSNGIDKESIKNWIKEIADLLNQGK